MPRNNIDIGLEVLRRITPEGARLTHRDIAAACGCSATAIVKIEQRAFAKMRKRCAELLKEQ